MPIGVMPIGPRAATDCGANPMAIGLDVLIPATTRMHASGMMLRDTCLSAIGGSQSWITGALPYARATQNSKPREMTE